MRFLVLVRPNEDEVARYEAGGMPAADDLEKMGAFNQTLINDVVIRDMGGLKPTSKSVRIDYSGAKPQITDGPFAETKELIAGFWLLEARSKEEIVERLSHCPFQRGESIEIRPLFQDEDFEAIV